jgi:hypothetical protein
MAGYRGPSIDHGLLSPSGKASKASRKALEDDYARRVAAWWAAKYPESPDSSRPSESARLRAHAARLRELAARGMSVRKFTKEAENAESMADKLDGGTP